MIIQSALSGRQSPWGKILRLGAVVADRGVVDTTTRRAQPGKVFDFNGASSVVSYDTGSTDKNEFANKKIKLAFKFNSLAGIQCLYSHGFTGAKVFVDNGALRLSGGTLLAMVVVDVWYELEVSYNASTQAESARLLDETGVETLWDGADNTVGPDGRSLFSVGARQHSDGSMGLWFNGVIALVSVDDRVEWCAQFAYDDAQDSSGTGNTGLMTDVSVLTDNTIPLSADRANLDGYTYTENILRSDDGAGWAGLWTRIYDDHDGWTKMVMNTEGGSRYMNHVPAFDGPGEYVLEASIKVVAGATQHRFGLGCLDGSWNGYDGEILSGAGYVSYASGLVGIDGLDENETRVRIKFTTDGSAGVYFYPLGTGTLLVGETAYMKNLQCWKNGGDEPVFTPMTNGDPVKYRRLIPRDQTNSDFNIDGEVLQNKRSIYPIVPIYRDNAGSPEADLYNVAVGDVPCPGTDHLGNFAAIPVGTSSAELRNTAPANTVFRRDVSPGVSDRLTAFKEPLEGDDLQFVLNYTASDYTPEYYATIGEEYSSPAGSFYTEP